MKRTLAMPLTLAALLLATAGWAQPPGGGGGAGGGGFQPTPEMRAKMQKWQQWRESHKNIQQLGGTVRSIMEMDKEAATKLTKDQAKKIWAAISPWTSKPTMTDAQAATLNKQITGVLTMPQVKKMAALSAANRRGGGGGGGRPGGGGGAGGGGGRGSFDPSKMPDPKEYNPLNVNSYPDTPFSARGKKAVTDFITMLKQRAA